MNTDALGSARIIQVIAGCGPTAVPSLSIYPCESVKSVFIRVSFCRCLGCCSCSPESPPPHDTRSLLPHERWRDGPHSSWLPPQRTTCSPTAQRTRAVHRCRQPPRSCMLHGSRHLSASCV